mgnify:CR=1 FL=1
MTVCFMPDAIIRPLAFRLVFIIPSDMQALTAFLELPPVKTQQYKALPRDHAYGVKHFRDIRTWLVAEGPWRSTCTGFDAEYKVKGTHPMGGAVSLLWHEQAGPVFAATTNRYALIEAPNMQSNSRKYIMSGTPRVEWCNTERFTVIWTTWIRILLILRKRICTVSMSIPIWWMPTSRLRFRERFP